MSLATSGHLITNLSSGCANPAAVLGVAAISFHIGHMKDEKRERRRTLVWGLPASLILHALITALLVYRLPGPLRQPQEEQAVNVTLVPPPDQPKPKLAPALPPKNPEAKKPQEPKIERPPEQNVEKPPPPEKPSTIVVLKPVFQFGEKDTGPRKYLDGGSAQDNSPSLAKNNDSKPPVVISSCTAKISEAGRS